MLVRYFTRMPRTPGQNPEEFRHPVSTAMENNVVKRIYNVRQTLMTTELVFTPEMREWVVRANKKLLPEHVTPETVMEWVATNRKFPYTTRQLFRMWEAIRTIRKSFGTAEAEAELEQIRELMEEAEGGNVPHRKNQSGEITLKAIGGDLGGLSPTAIKNMGDAAVLKLRARGMDISKEEFDRRLHKASGYYIRLLRASIDIAKADVAEAVDDTEVTGEFSVEDFFDGLHECGIISSKELALVEDLEMVAVQALADHIITEQGNTDKATELLERDYLGEYPVVKTFQNCVSREWEKK